MSIANRKFKSAQEANEYLLSLPAAPLEIDSRAVLYSCVKKTKNVGIGPYSVIGRDGFGYKDGRRIPHIGGVIIEEYVEIGSNSCIDRAKLDNTIIGAHTKIDNLVHVGHNAVIGRGCIIVAGSVIGGSCVLGDNVFVGQNATIKDHVKVGNNVIIGCGANVIKDVPDGQTVVGNPAKPLAVKSR